MKSTIKKSIAVGGVVLTLGGQLAIPTTATALNEVDVVVRIGEFQNKNGKRLVGIDENFNIDCPIRYDKETGYHIQEYDLNKKLATKIYDYLRSQGVNVMLQDTKGKSEDLGSAGRKAKSYNPKIYLSCHHNSYNSNSSGYLFVTNNDTQSKKYAKQISNAMTSNPILLGARENQINYGNISELSVEPADVNMIFEAGFALSNKEEAKKCASDEYMDFIARTMGNELIQILNEINNSKGEMQLWQI